MKNRNLMVVVAGLVLLAKVASAQAVESFTVTPWDVKKASVEFKRDGSATLACTLTTVKAIEFAQATERNLNKKLRLVINGRTISEPVIRETITSGALSVEIKSADEAVDLAKHLMRELPNSTPEVTR